MEKNPLEDLLGGDFSTPKTPEEKVKMVDKAEKSEDGFSWREFRVKSKIHWSEFTEFKDYVQILKDLFDLCIVLPDIALPFKPLILSYIACPSALSEVLPILWLIGKSGSGKSTLSKFASFIRHDRAPCGSSTTYAGLRNLISQSKYKNGEEVNLLLAWDDFDEKVFISQPSIFRLFKSGRDRSSSIIEIAEVGEKLGSNKRFCTFSSAVLSSVHPIFENPQFSELNRRTFAIEMQKSPIMSQPVDTIDFRDLPSMFNKLWHNRQNCQSFIDHKRWLIRETTKSLPIDFYTMFIDVLATGLSLELIAEQSQSIEMLEAYFDYKNQISTKDTFLQLLHKEIDKQFGAYKEAYLVINDAYPDISNFVLTPINLLNQAKDWYAKGLILDKPTNRLLMEYMEKLNYTLTEIGYKIKE